MMILRPLTTDDVQSLVINANNPNVAEFLRDIFPSPYTTQDAERWILADSQTKQTHNLAIDLNGECIGNIGLMLGENEHRYTAEFGYWLGEAHWGKGFATLAVREFVDYAFQNFDLRRLFAPVATDNVASIRVLEKSGLIREATFRKNIFLRGKLYDEAIFAAYP